MSEQKVNVGVVGASGLVGGYVIDILKERGFPIGDLRLYASERSAGTDIVYEDKTITVENVAQADFADLDLVIFSAGGSVSKEQAPRAVEAGAIVVDNSSAWRQDKGVPLVVAGVNDEALGSIPKGIVANPNCTTMVAMPVLKALHDFASLEAMTVTSLQAVSGAGNKGIQELKQQLATNGKEVQVFPEPVAYNVIPLRGTLVGRDTDEELKLRNESRKILDIGHLTVAATCWTVPVFNGHSLTIEARFHDSISPEEAEAVLSETDEVQLCDIPTPLQASGGNDTLVGRIRQSDNYGQHGLSFVLTGDNLRKGAALNAVQLGELILIR